MPRQDLAANLFAYGEEEAASKIHGLPAADYDRVGSLGFEISLTGVSLARAACLAAIEVIEGQRRELRRKRRDLSLVPEEHRVQDPQAKQIDEWIDSYSGGEPVGKDEVFAGLAAALAPALSDFRYFKSAAQFRAKTVQGTKFVCFERGHGILSIRFGLTHALVERTRHAIFGRHWKSRVPTPETISMHSANIGPRHHRWRHPTDAQWPVLGSQGLERACVEVVQLVRDLALPWLREHEEPAAIRQTYLFSPSRAEGFPPEEIVFAIDYLTNRPDLLDSDCQMLLERYATYPQDYRDRVTAKRAITVAHFRAASH